MHVIHSDAIEVPFLKKHFFFIHYFFMLNGNFCKTEGYIKGPFWNHTANNGSSMAL